MPGQETYEQLLEQVEQLTDLLARRDLTERIFDPKARQLLTLLEQYLTANG